MKILTLLFSGLLMDPNLGEGGGTGAPGAGLTPPPVPGTPPTPPEGEQPPTRVLGHGGAPMNEEAVSDVRARERRKFLRDEYGTDDETEAAKIRLKRKEEAEAAAKDREELAKLRRTEESRARAKMTEQQRLQKDLEEANNRIKSLEGELTNERNTVRSTKQDQVIREGLGVHIEPKYVKLARAEFLEHVKTLDAEELKKFDAKALEKWVTKKLLAEYPEWAKKVPQTAEEKQKAEEEKRKAAASNNPPRKLPIGGPRVPPKPTPKPADRTIVTGNKTIAPGPNMMSRQELNAIHRQRGGSTPY